MRDRYDMHPLAVPIMLVFGIIFVASILVGIATMPAGSQELEQRPKLICEFQKVLSTLPLNPDEGPLLVKFLISSEQPPVTIVYQVGRTFGLGLEMDGPCYTGHYELISRNAFRIMYGPATFDKFVAALTGQNT